jgi:hypothetical protein
MGFNSAFKVLKEPSHHVILPFEDESSEVFSFLQFNPWSHKPHSFLNY